MNAEVKIAHLGFIQLIINRMGVNSFLLKGWSITLVAAIFALSAKDANQRFILLAYCPVIVFWILDSFFLHQEKLFRKLYEEVAVGHISSDQFTLDTSCVTPKIDSQCRVFLSKTLLIFYGSIISVILIAMFVLT